jgi:hypothetical protein
MSIYKSAANSAFPLGTDARALLVRVRGSDRAQICRRLTLRGIGQSGHLEVSLAPLAGTRGVIHQLVHCGHTHLTPSHLSKSLTAPHPGPTLYHHEC